MEYTRGKLGRVFVARLSDGESIYDAVHEIAEKEHIVSAAVMAVGGMRSGRIVTGPEKTTGKVIPHIEEFDDAREMVGFGTLFAQEGRPSLHLHAGIGKEKTAMVGCPRVAMSVYLVLEVVIIEICDLDARRELDPDFGVHLLKILSPA